jgi:DNA-binding response OmpR family regulator
MAARLHNWFTSMSGQRLAILDSDTGFLHVLTRRLQAAGWESQVLDRPVQPDFLTALRLNAAIIDPAVLGAGAWLYLDRLCTRLPGLAVIICTLRAPLADRVRGLRMGADDWVTKPCHPEELIARVEAVARRRRRAESRSEQQRPVVGELEIRADCFQAFVEGRSAALTRREFELLSLLAEAEGQVLQREDVYRQLWGYEMARGDRSVDVYVGKLRAKLERASPRWRYVHTHFRIGYRLTPEPLEAPAPARAAPALAPTTVPPAIRATAAVVAA